MFELCKFIMSKTENENPKDQDGVTAFHLAAEKGHLEICTYMMECFEDKMQALHFKTNPKGSDKISERSMTCAH